ncbi:MAG: Zinc-binding dehydrogenase [Pseudomonadota bacterium]|jgi:alcohol dehydrogenase|nr:Zinc-binding dehydrogenase [Pseudomonadota bacterium]MDQ1308819.1 Zinc-binding dehydrogenase [Pseudomonadota bacterium]
MPVERAVWRIPRAGSLGRLALCREPLAEPGPGEARVRVEAIGLNFADLFACQGLYSATPQGSFIPGLECAGTIEALGLGFPGEADLRIGDRVVALTRFGAYATVLNVAAALLRRVPAGWSAAQAAAWPVQGLTAWYGLVPLGAVKSGDVVLVQSAAGGVGLQALAMLQTLGARPLAVVGHESKRRFLIEQRGLAPDAVVVRDRRQFARQLDAGLAALGTAGFDCVLDAVLGPGFRPSFERLRPEGRYVLFGAADFMTASVRPNYLRLAFDYLRRPRLDPLAMISANRSLMAFNLIWLWNHAERLPEAYRQLEALAPLPPHVGALFPFERAPEAMRLLQGGGTVGKVVLAVGGG